MTTNSNSNNNTSDSTNTNDIAGPTMTVDGRHVPEEIKSDRLWVLWDLQIKQPRAPWRTGNCKTTLWNGRLDDDERPETTYRKAREFAKIDPRELARTHPFRDDEEIPERLGCTIMLPPEGDDGEISYPTEAVEVVEDGQRRIEYRTRDVRLMYIDLDDVRNPETREVTPEALEIVRNLASYTEISSSGTGIHILVYGRLPDGIGHINGSDLDGPGSIELYDHGRFFGGTWRHVEGTPTEIHERQDVVDELLEQYAQDRLEDARKKREARERTQDQRDRTGQKTPRRSGSPTVAGKGKGNGKGKGERSPYFDVNTGRFAAPVPHPEIKSTSNGEQGAHPVHGKTTSGEECTNYKVDRSGVWHCFACGSGGGALEMAAVMAGVFDCHYAGAGALTSLDDREFLEVCLYARDELDGFDAEMPPPYRALVAVAKLAELPLSNPDKEIMGKLTAKYAHMIYDEISTDDLDDLDVFTDLSTD